MCLLIYILTLDQRSDKDDVVRVSHLWLGSSCWIFPRNMLADALQVALQWNAIISPVYEFQNKVCHKLCSQSRVIREFFVFCQDSCGAMSHCYMFLCNHDDVYFRSVNRSTCWCVSYVRYTTFLNQTNCGKSIDTSL